MGALKRTVLDFLGLKVDVPVSEAPVAGSQAAAKAASATGGVRFANMAK